MLIFAGEKFRDLYKKSEIILNESPFALSAIHDEVLWENIRHHRSVFNPIRGIDYEAPIKGKLIPPVQYRNIWENDYNAMQEQMVYGQSLSFEELLSRISELQNRFKTDRQ